MRRDNEINARIKSRLNISPLAWLVFAVVAGASIGTSSGQSESPAAPSAVVTGVIAALEQTLGDTTLTVRDREQRIRDLLQDHFDIPAISRYVLGRYSAGASRQEQDTFADLFQRWMIVTYTGTVKGLNEASWTVVRTRPEGAESVVVNSEIPQVKSRPIEIDWRLHQDGDQYKIIDVSLQGISLVLVEREEAASIIQRNGGTVTGLNEALERRFGSDNDGLALSAGH
jgi:phospholipid transport system substrate-binding protein